MPSTIDSSSGCCTWFRCYSLEDSDRELLISVLLGGMKYSALMTSLLAQSELTVQQVEDALKNEEAHCLGALLQFLLHLFAHSVPNPDTLLSTATSSRSTASVQRKRSRRPLIIRKRRGKIAQGQCYPGTH